MLGESLFGWVFTIFSWNLICRACTTARICLPNMKWIGDCLRVVIPRHKGNQTGLCLYIIFTLFICVLWYLRIFNFIGDKYCKAPKHIFANPLMPEICPILALAIYILLNYRAGDKKKKLSPLLFHGEDQKNRYTKILKDLSERFLF